MHTLAAVSQRGDWPAVERFFNESEGVRLFGARVSLADPERPEVYIDQVQDKHRGGVAGAAVNGAVQAALHDLCAGAVGFNYWERGVSPTTSLRIDYLRPLVATSVRFVAEVTERAGDRLYAVSRAYNQEGTLCSICYATLRLNVAPVKTDARPVAAPAHTGASFWEARYAEAEYAYGTQPNAFFQTYLDQLPPGNLLLPAEGEGRNAVYAAGRGWQVDAVDFSKAARQKARELAAERGVRINYTVGDLLDFVPRHDYDAVALVFFHADPTIRAKVLRRYQSFVRPGGVFLLEGFTPEQVAAGNPSGGPKKPEFCYTEEELRDAFSDFHLVYLSTETADLAEGRYHDGRAHTVQLVARRK